MIKLINPYMLQNACRDLFIYIENLIPISTSVCIFEDSELPKNCYAAKEQSGNNEKYC